MKLDSDLMELYADYYKSFKNSVINCQSQEISQTCNISSIVKFTNDVYFYDQLLNDNELQEHYGLNSLVGLLSSKSFLVTSNFDL